MLRKDKPAWLTPACQQTLENNSIGLPESLQSVLNRIIYAMKSPRLPSLLRIKNIREQRTALIQQLGGN